MTNETLLPSSPPQAVDMSPPPTSILPPPYGSPTNDGSGSTSGLTNGELVAVIVVSVIGGLIILAILGGFLYIYFQRSQRKWAPAKGAFDGVVVSASTDLQQEAPTEAALAPSGQVTAPGTPSTTLRSTPVLDDCDVAGPSGDVAGPSGFPASRHQQEEQGTPTRATKWNLEQV